MIAKYNGKYYCAMNYGPEMNIWRYPVEELNVKEGYVLPNEELIIKRDDIEEVFYGLFQAVWNDLEFAISMPIDHSFVSLILNVNEKDIAEKYGFELQTDDTDGYQLYTKNIGLDEIGEFIFCKTMLLPNENCEDSIMPYISEQTTTKMTKDAWVMLYHEMDYKPYWVEEKE